MSFGTVSAVMHTALLRGQRLPTVAVPDQGQVFLGVVQLADTAGSLWMMVVFRIFIEVTPPDRIQPRMETLPVKGHFWSTRAPSTASLSISVVCRRFSLPVSASRTLPLFRKTVGWFGKHAQSQCPPSSQVPEEKKQETF